MEKRLLLALAVVLVLGAIPASASGSVTRTYGAPPVGWNFLDSGTGPWDLTQCDLVLSFTLDVSNLFNEPQILYRGFKGRTNQTTVNFVTLTAGVNGRF